MPKKKSKHDFPQVYEGEPMYIQMQQFEDEKVSRGTLQLQCCDCGLKHLFTVEGKLDDIGRGKFVMRAYRLD